MSARAGFHGWRIVALGAALIWLGPGLLECYGFLAKPLAAEFGLSAEAFGVGIAALILPLVIAGPAIGWLLDRGPLRPVLLGAVALAGCGLGIVASAHNVGVLALGAAIAALGLGTYGQIGPNVMVAGWFVRMRSRALAATSLGTSCAGVTIPLLTPLLIAHFGWRGMLLTFAGAVVLLLGPAIAWLAVKRPAEIGQAQDGDDAGALEPVGDVAPAERRATSLAEVLRDRNFWLLGGSLAIAVSVSLGGIHLVHHMQNVGLSSAQAGYVASLMSGGALLGRLGTGWLHDRYPKQLVAALVFALSGVGWIGVAYARDLGAFLALALPAGLAAGGFGVSGPVLQAACFGPSVLGRVMGLHGVLGLPLLLATPVLVGRSGDALGSFTAVFVALGVAMGAAAGAMLLVRAPHAIAVRAPAPA
ncbi:MAG: MFS transporter [Myxococcota bacterium]|jgi:sugar phosphate permease